MGFNEVIRVCNTLVLQFQSYYKVKVKLRLIYLFSISDATST